MMKKLLAVLLALCLTAALVPGTALAAGNPFQDVKPGAWYYDQVQYVYNKDLMGGTGSGTFGPNTPTNRGMVAFILYKIEGSPAVSGGSGFVDVTTQYFANAVKWASQNKIVAGTGNGRFTPNSPVTREQLALMLYNYAKYKEFDVSRTKELIGYQDYSKIHTWGREALSWANGMGFINGVGGNRIDPTGNATRAQLAVILCSFCQKYIDNSTSTPTPTPAPSGKVSVRFDYNYEGAPAGPVLTVKTGEKVESINPPTREGYTFLGWYTQPAGGSLFSFDTAVSGDMTLYAQWSGAQTFQVAFDLNYEGSLPLDSVNVVSGQLCPFPEFIPQRENYNFDGWFTSPDDKGVKFDFATTPVTASMTLYAHWSYNGPNWAKPYQTSNDITYYDGTDSLKYFTMMGIQYKQGLVWNSTQSDDTEALFNLGGKYEVMTFDLGHIDNDRRAEETLYFYFDGGTTPAAEMKLTGAMSTEHIVLNVKNRTQLRIVRKGPWGYAYAMANMRWFTTAEAQSQEIVTPASISVETVKETNLASGPVLPYQVSSYVTAYDGVDPLKFFKMMGIEYNQGIIFHSTQSDNTDALFNLGGGFDMISFKLGHIDNDRRREETIYVWADDELVDTISLNGAMSTTTYFLNVQGVNKLQLIRQGDWGYAYGLADITVYTASDVQDKGLTVPALSSREDVIQTNLAAGPVMPYQNSGDITLNDGSDPLNKFMMAGIEFTQGVIFHSTQSDDTDINFNLGKGFTTMTFTAGHIDNDRTAEETLYFYKDGVLDESATLTLTGNMPNTPITLDVTGVNNLHIVRKGPWGYAYALANITVS
jgi:uncharacterized repeat protein (TIGR02543 family)